MAMGLEEQKGEALRFGRRWRREAGHDAQVLCCFWHLFWTAWLVPFLPASSRGDTKLQNDVSEGCVCTGTHHSSPCRWQSHSSVSLVPCQGLILTAERTLAFPATSPGTVMPSNLENEQATCGQGDRKKDSSTNPDYLRTETTEEGRLYSTSYWSKAAAFPSLFFWLPSPLSKV
ncbi:uncharacterized protein LOC121074889 isoform X2 [Cygnus olor]|uniref:uncharacterized protein LOC121074889 isoform X2 n=1 Tax=Cygnus olor TaxID=8869 RepID=UPI001ADE2913|nr:uncharacterized protein LOC121074889 isoform X2 [Cygnus olor]